MIKNKMKEEITYLGKKLVDFIPITENIGKKKKQQTNEASMNPWMFLYPLVQLQFYDHILNNQLQKFAKVEYS